ncbi:MAG: DUF1543 domain-containing protein [Flavisolibacter sp.]|nr:DUF1543 domain-containing protein [Flavisolibacter sp.]
MNDLKLYMILLGCKPAGRNTEQHDLFFGIGRSLGDVKNDIIDFWKEANGKIHIDGWREVQSVDGYAIEVVNKDGVASPQKEKLFFINLGGYKQNEFEEFHYKMLTVATDKGIAVQKSKQTAFYKHTGFEGAASHIDDKYGIDVDDIYEIEDILPSHLKEQYTIQITKADNLHEDELHLGYLKIDKL